MTKYEYMTVAWVGARNGYPSRALVNRSSGVVDDFFGFPPGSEGVEGWTYTRTITHFGCMGWRVISTHPATETVARSVMLERVAE